MKYGNGTHTIYYNKNNEEVPSATTILKIINKPALVNWANYLGFNHLNVDEVLNESAQLGTVVHDLINSILLNCLIIYVPRPDIPTRLVFEYVKRFKNWLNINDVNPILLETSFSTDTFGGTIDFYGEINGKKTILDFKTSKKIRISMFFQLALYCILLEEHGYEVEQVGILLVNNKHEDEKYIDRKDFDKYIEFARVLVNTFHLYYDINYKYKWNENIF